MDLYEIRGSTHQSQIHKSFYADGVPPPFHREVRLGGLNTVLRPCKQLAVSTGLPIFSNNAREAWVLLLPSLSFCQG